MFFGFLFCWFGVFLQGDNCITSVLDCPTLKYVGCVSIFLCFFYLVLTFLMVVGFVGVGRDLVFLQNLNKHFGCLGEQIYKKIYLPTSL